MEPKLHLIPTFHHDIAYLRPESWYTERATAILDKAIELMEADEHYTFTVEQVYFFREYWNTHPELHDRLRLYVRRGQLHFAPGMWVVPDMTMLSGESMFMQATLGRNFLAETVGYRPRSAFIADCWGHHAQTPQILSQCGYDYYVFSRCMYPSWDIENYNWRGLDGSVLRTHWMSTAYAGISFPDSGEAVNAEELHWEQASKAGIQTLCERNKKHCGDDPQLIPSGGDMRMPGTSASAVVARLREDPELSGLSFSDFDSSLDGIDYSAKPTYEGEFISSFKGSFVTNINIKIRNRQLENRLYSLELLSVLRQKHTDFMPLWDVTLKNQFHDILCGTVCDEALVQIIREQTKALADLDEIRESLGGERKKAYFNPNNFPVTEIREEEGTLKHLAADGFGFAKGEALVPEKISMPESFENEYYKVQLNRRGYITSLTEKKTGRKLVDSPAIPFGGLQMQIDNGDSWTDFEYPSEVDVTVYADNRPDPYDRSRLPVHPNLMVARDGVQSAEAFRLGEKGLRIVQKGRLGWWATIIPFTITITFTADSPRIEYHTELDCQSKRLRVRAAFPASYKDGRIRHQIPYGMMERGEGPQAVQMMMDYESDGAGLALLNRGLPHNNTEDGIMMVSLLRAVSMEYKCTSTLSYGFGEHFVLDYAIVPHAADEDTQLWQQALSFNRPMVRTDDAPLTGLAVEGAFLSAARYVDEDIFLRVFGGLDRSAEAVIRVPAGYTRFALTDGCMNPGEVQRICDGCVRLTLGAQAVQGVRLMK